MITSWVLQSPFQLFIVIASYLSIITMGPLLMKNRAPLNLRFVLIVFNASQVLFNTCLMLTGIPVMHKPTIFCSPDHDTDAHETALVTLLYHRYLLLKLYDLLDTVFFVLRKKQAQISFLHVYHHILILVVVWVNAKLFPPESYPAGPSLLFGGVNCGVHVCMYMYYLKSVIDKNDVKNIWWKKYVTIMQLVQHYVMFSLCLNALMAEECPYPKYILFCGVGGFFTMMYLFTKFYYNAYISKELKVVNGCQKVKVANGTTLTKRSE